MRCAVPSWKILEKTYHEYLRKLPFIDFKRLINNKCLMSLAEEWEKPYPTVRGFINARMSVALVRATNRCIRGSRIPVSIRWEGGAGYRNWNSERNIFTM